MLIVCRIFVGVLVGDYKMGYFAYTLVNGIIHQKTCTGSFNTAPVLSACTIDQQTLSQSLTSAVTMHYRLANTQPIDHLKKSTRAS